MSKILEIIKSMRSDGDFKINFSLDDYYTPPSYQKFLADKINSISSDKEKIDPDLIHFYREKSSGGCVTFRQSLNQEIVRSSSNLFIQAIDSLYLYTLPPGNYQITLTEKFNWRRSDFGDQESCFWISRTGARDMLTANGAFAVLISYKKKKGGPFSSTSQRAWAWWDNNIQKLVVFNIYDKNNRNEFDSYVFPFLPSILRYGLNELNGGDSNISYRCKLVSLTNNGSTSAQLYVNKGIGYVIDNVRDERVDRIDLGWNEMPSRTCSSCERYKTIDDLQPTAVEGFMYCDDCVDNSTDICMATLDLWPKHHLLEGPDGQLYNIGYWVKHFIVCMVTGKVLLKEEAKEFHVTGDLYIYVDPNVSLDQEVFQNLIHSYNEMLEYGDLDELAGNASFY